MTFCAAHRSFMPIPIQPVPARLTDLPGCARSPAAQFWRAVRSVGRARCRLSRRLRPRNKRRIIAQWYSPHAQPQAVPDVVSLFPHGRLDRQLLFWVGSRGLKGLRLDCVRRFDEQQHISPHVPNLDRRIIAVPSSSGRLRGLFSAIAIPSPD